MGANHHFFLTLRNCQSSDKIESLLINISCYIIPNYVRNLIIVYKYSTNHQDAETSSALIIKTVSRNLIVFS